MVAPAGLAKAEATTTMSVAESILAVAASICERDGHEAVQVRPVAKRARVSLSTIYKHFSSREELLTAAIAQWMERNVYRPTPEVPVDAPLAERVLAILEPLMAPWRHSPNMLEAFVRARIGPHRTVLNEQSTEEASELIRSQFGGADPDDVNDVIMLLDNVLYALLARTVAGERTFDELTQMTRLAVVRLTAPFS